MKNKFLSYGRQMLDSKDVQAVVKVLRSDRLTQGPMVQAFEEAFAGYCGARYAVAVSNGTAGLHLAVLAAGLKAGDEAVTSPVTFVATVNSFVYAGVTPRFADINAQSLGLDGQKVLKAMNGLSKAVMNVHFAGQPNLLPPKREFSSKANFFMMEDACHALGASYRSAHGWKKIGSCADSDIAVFSFHPVKSITTGEGGMVTTRHKAIYDKLRLLRSHGLHKDISSLPWYYEMRELGFNYRITDIQCALGLSQLKKLDLFIEKRRRIADFYDRRFRGIDVLRVPARIPGTLSSHHLHVLQFDFKKMKTTRQALMRRLAARGIGTQVHYIPVTRQPYYRKRFGTRAGDFPVAEAYYESALSIPIYPSMTSSQTRHVANEIEKACR